MNVVQLPHKSVGGSALPDSAFAHSSASMEVGRLTITDTVEP